MGAELFHADRRMEKTDGQTDIMNLIVAFAIARILQK